jgi:Bacterial Ig domain
MTATPNLAPVLDTVRVTRQGVNVTVGINASDPDSDALSLTLTGVLGVDGETFENAAAADAAIFQLPFSPDAKGTVTITTSVSDGTNATTQTDQIYIAPLQLVIFGAGEIVASNGASSAMTNSRSMPSRHLCCSTPVASPQQHSQTNSSTRSLSTVKTPARNRSPRRSPPTSKKPPDSSPTSTSAASTSTTAPATCSPAATRHQHSSTPATPAVGSTSATRSPPNQRSDHRGKQRFNAQGVDADLHLSKSQEQSDR